MSGQHWLTCVKHVGERATQVNKKNSAKPETVAKAKCGLGGSIASWAAAVTTGVHSYLRLFSMDHTSQSLRKLGTRRRLARRRRVARQWEYITPHPHPPPPL